MADDTITVGDRIRFSTELLQQIDRLPRRQSPIATVRGIGIDPNDGTKTVVLELVDPPPLVGWGDHREKAN